MKSTRRMKTIRRIVALFIVAVLLYMTTFSAYAADAVPTSSYNSTYSAAWTNWDTQCPTYSIPSTPSGIVDIRFTYQKLKADTYSIVGFAGSTIATNNNYVNDFTAAFRSNNESTGYFTCYNNSTPTYTNLIANATGTYQVEMIVDVSGDVYDCWVIKPDASLVQLANNFGTNNDSATNIGKVCLIDYAADSATDFTISNLVVKNFVSSATTYDSFLKSTSSPYSATTYLKGRGIPLTNRETKLTGNRYFQFDVTPDSTAQGSIIGYSDGDVVVDQDSDFCMQVRLNTSTYFDVSNGAGWEYDNTVTYAAATVYHVEIYCDVANKLYDVYVTPAGGARKQVGSSCAFTTGGNGANANDIGQVHFEHITTDKDIHVDDHYMYSYAGVSTDDPAIGTVTVAAADVTPTSFHAAGAGETIEWFSYDTSKATIVSGNVHAVAAGSVTIAYRVITTATSTIHYWGSLAIEVQPDLIEQDAPTGLTATTPTTLSDNNGYISGTTTLMEYKLSTAGSYTTCMAGATTGLAHGDYLVRYAAEQVTVQVRIHR